MLNIVFMILVYYFLAHPFMGRQAFHQGSREPEQWKNGVTVVEKVMVFLLSSWNNVCSLLPCPRGQLEALQL